MLKKCVLKKFLEQHLPMVWWDKINTITNSKFFNLAKCFLKY